MSETTEFEGFPSTRWALVSRLSHPDVQVQRAALADLLARYLPAIRSYLICVRRIPSDQADDLLQSFLVSKVLKEEMMHRASAERGKFRTFLLTSLDRFLVSVYRQQTAAKRGGMTTPLETVAEPISAEPRPDEAFDLTWARELLAGAIRMMEEECRRTGRPDIWGVFRHRVLAEVLPDVELLEYEALVARFGLKSPAHASNVLITGKRMFSRILRGLVAEYEPEEQRIDAELAELRQILGRASGA